MLISSLLIGIALPAAVVAAMTAVQRLTPEHLLGRVAASATSMVFAPTAVAIPVGAGLLTVVDYRVPFLLAALMSVAASWYTIHY